MPQFRNIRISGKLLPLILATLSSPSFAGNELADIPNTQSLSDNSLAVVKNILSPTANLADELDSLPPTAAGSSEKSFTVQLGAFADAEAMHEFADNHGLRDLENLLGHRVKAKGKFWYVITWGAFASPDQAQEAWLKHKDNYSQVSHWVRSLDSLSKAKMWSE